MKRCLFVTALMMAVLLCFADEVKRMFVAVVEKRDGTQTEYYVDRIDSIYFEADSVLKVVYDGSLVESVNASQLKEVTFVEKVVTEPVVPEGTEVKITWNGTEVAVVNPYEQSGVKVDVTGADVVVTSTTADEIEYVLDGTSNAGSLKIYSDKKYQLTLKGLALTNPNGPAINSQTGKKMELKAQKGYVNTLTDGAKYADSAEDQKGCVFSEGQIIVKGAGELNIIGNCKHGLCSDDYVIVENSTLNITSAKDAIHANDSIGIEGGVITLSPKGDGIDCEGPVVIDQAEGCSLDITVPSDTCKAIKSDVDVRVLAGTISISASGKGAKGIKTNGTLTIGTEDGNGPKLTITTTGAQLTTGSTTGGSTGGWGGGWGGRPGGGGGPGGSSAGSGSSSKAIKAQGIATVYGGELNISTSTSGAEGLESKTAIYIEGGNHYFKCYDDCINSKGNIYFNGGNTVCYGYGNDAVDSNAGRTGAITIGNGNVFAFTTKGSPEEGLDCDNNSYIQIKGSGIAISGGGAQGGGSSSSTISNAYQGYKFVTSSISYSTGRYYTLADAEGNNMVTYSFPVSCSSTLALFTAPGMKKGSTYTIKYSTTKPTDAKTVVGGGSGQAGLYIGSTAKGTTNVTSFTAN